MDTIDFQGWVYSNIEVKPPYPKNDMWFFGAVIFGMPHTIKGNATSSGGVFCLDFGVLPPSEEEVFVSSKLINQAGGYEEALRLRITEFFVGSLDYDNKREALCKYNRFFGGGVSLFIHKRSNPKCLSAKELLQSFEGTFKKEDRENENKKIIKKLNTQIDTFSKLLKKSIVENLGVFDKDKE